MTKGETGKLLNILLRWYPQARQLQGDTARTQDAWHAALEPYDYRDILDAARAWYQGPKGRFCPDPRELIPETRRQTAEPEPEQSAGIEPKRIPTTEERLRILDYLHRDEPEEYLAALDDWDRDIKACGAEAACGATLERLQQRRQEIRLREERSA